MTTTLLVALADKFDAYINFDYGRAKVGYGEQFERIALVIGTSLIGVVMVGAIIGAMLPLILRAFKFAFLFGVAG